MTPGLATLGLTEAHVYDAPCGCVAATLDRRLLGLCSHGNRWRYLVTYTLHRSDRGVWCGPVMDGCAVEMDRPATAVERRAG